MKKLKVIFLCLFLAGMFISQPAQSSEKSESEILVDKATTVVKGFATDPSLEWFRKTAKNAKALLIIPQNIKGAFLVGGSGGSGVLVAKDSNTGEWSNPAFYTLGAVSVGLQIGGEVSELILMIMSDRGMESLLASSFKLGADVSVAVGPEGAGTTAKTADVLSFSRTKGAFIGLSLDGAVVKTRDAKNEAYYGKKVSPADILVRRNIANPHSQNLQKAVTDLTSI